MAAVLLLVFLGPPLVAWPVRRVDPAGGNVVVALAGELALLALAGVVLLAARRDDARPLASLGLGPLRLASIAWGLLLAAFFVFVYGPLVVRAVLAFDPHAFAAGLRGFERLPLGLETGAVVVGGSVEELLYRGYALERIARLTGSTWTAAVVTVLAFGAAHVPFWGGVFSLSTVLAGTILTLFYVWRRDLWSTIVAHVVTDAVGLIVAPPPG